MFIACDIITVGEESIMSNNQNMLKKINEAVDESIQGGAGFKGLKRSDLKGRIAVIAEALNEGMSLNEANELLTSKGFEKLYARSFDESVIIYAFCNRLTFEAWQELDQSCRTYYEKNLSSGMNNLLNGTLKRAKLKEYLESESAEDGYATGIVTGLMSKELEQCETEEELQQYLASHLKDFTDTREKARYYFCKYLNEYIEDKCSRYLKAAKSGSKRSQLLALEDISFLKPLTELKREAELDRNKMSYEDKEAFLEETSVVPGGIFDEFSYYYGYITVDWIELIFERFGSPDEWDEELKADIVEVLGYREDEAEQKLRELEAEIIEREEQLDQEYNRESGTDRKKLYQRYRAGENYFRAFLNGSRDINRETLIAFILFISKKMELKGAMRVDAARLNIILDNCGFKQLKPKDNEFDRFIIEFINSKTPFIVMEDRVDEQICQGKNFDFYKVYSNAYSHTDEIQKFMQKQQKKG